MNHGASFVRHEARPKEANATSAKNEWKSGMSHGRLHLIQKTGIEGLIRLTVRVFKRMTSCTDCGLHSFSFWHGNARRRRACPEVGTHCDGWDAGHFVAHEEERIIRCQT
jgi:hypothetical protein